MGHASPPTFLALFSKDGQDCRTGRGDAVVPRGAVLTVSEVRKAAGPRLRRKSCMPVGRSRTAERARQAGPQWAHGPASTILSRELGTEGRGH
jgi:hypothetical protein